MDLLNTCLATAALHRLRAKLNSERREFHLAEAAKLEARADTEARLKKSFRRPGQLSEYLKSSAPQRER
jgi:hypothetical protein